MNKQEDKKNLIIQTALAMFLKEGYDRVSVMDICKTCGITKPTFYKYVTSKEQLLRYYFRGTVEDLSACIRAMDPTNYWEIVCTGLTFTMQKSVRLGPGLYSRYWILNFNEKSEAPPYMSEAHTMTIEAIQKGQKAGQIKNPSDPALLYLTCRNVGLGYALKWCMSNGAFDLIDRCRADFAAILQVDDHQQKKTF